METLTITEALKKKAHIRGINTDNVYNIAEALSINTVNEYEDGDIIECAVKSIQPGYIFKDGAAITKKTAGYPDPATQTSCGITDFIQVFPHCELKIWNARLNSSLSLCGYGYADDSDHSGRPEKFKVRISSNSGTPDGTDEYGPYNIFTIPENVYRIRSTVWTTRTVKAQLTYHSEPVTP